MYINQTHIFRTILADKLGHITADTALHAPSSSGEPSQGPSRAVSPAGLRNRFPVAGKRDGGTRKRKSAGRVSRETEEEYAMRREFMDEAYRIHKQLAELTDHLRLIRRAYLSTTPPPLPSRLRQQQHSKPGKQNETDDPERQRLRYLENTKYLSEREKDEVDVRARLIIKTCRDRVELLERREKRGSSPRPSATDHRSLLTPCLYAHLVRQSKAPTTQSTPSSLLSHFLPSLRALTTSGGADNSLTPQQCSSIMAAHHAAVIWFLNAELLKVSERQREMQEDAAKIRDERGKSLGGLVGRETGAGNAWRRLGASSSNANTNANAKPLSLTIPYKPSTTQNSGAATDPTDVDDDPLATNAALHLTPTQLQQFSTENTHLLESMASTLDTVLHAERSLLEISQLQTTLISHLASQTETIERLYDDANGAMASVEQANVQLREAKQSGRDARFFLLVFLVGASLALLFLDWYSS
ncbi:hypothetical protein QFC21_005033 [Naganishia friedmannii]|uniref:Uncharacterized protein n=1 Tax=Naganishia friedmannii TaxID=89922 RepID=A0ACC2VCB3_9TREE|nr:hypothetical protein QFC21_005033 [Naganishia friedmannii]